MKNTKKTLAAVLAAILMIAVLPPQTIAHAVEDSYSVLAEYSWKGFFSGSGYSNSTTGTEAIREGDNGYCLIRYNGTSIERASDYYYYLRMISDQYYEVTTFVSFDKGVLDANGTVVLPIQYDSVAFYGGTQVIAGKNGTSYLCDLTTGTQMPYTESGTPSSTEGGHNLHRSYIYDETTGQCNFDYYCYKDWDTEEVVIPGPFSDASDFVDGYALVSVEGVYRVIDTKGNTVCSSFIATPVALRGGGSVIVKNDASGYGFQSVDGKTIIPVGTYDNIVTDRIYGGDSGYLKVHKAGKGFGVADINGNEIIPCAYSDVDEFYDGNYWAVFGYDQSVALLDKTGKIIVPGGTYDEIVSVGVYSLYDLEGEHWEVLRRQPSGTVERGVIDKNGTLIFGMGNYSSIKGQSPSGDYWEVVSGGEHGIVDRNGDFVVPYGDYDDFLFQQDGLIWGINEEYEDGSTTTTVDILKPMGVLNKDAHIYDTSNPGEGVADLIEGAADKVNSEDSAVKAVNTLTGKMTTEQKQSATGADLATLLAETAAAKAASQAVTGKEIIINKANVAPLAEKAGSAVDAVDAALVSGGITTARYLSNTIILTSTETGEIAIKIDPDILETEVDKVRVETPNYALTLKISDLEEDLTGVITIKSSTVTASASGGGAAMAPVFMKASAPRTSSSKTTAVKLDVPNGKLKGPVTISFPDHDGDADGNETVVDADNNAKFSKYNPATSTMDGKVTESGTYTTTTNSKDFTDIGNKSKEMQEAIRYLASKGIINGTSETTFSPDGAIKRSEVAALLVRSLGKLDTSAKSTFADVKTSDWYYATAASSAKCGLIKGYEDNTFHGNNNILKQETVTVVSRVLQTEMGYKVPSNTAIYLTRYSDTIPNWVKQDLALATRENLIVYRVDGTFSGSKTITRGDAAIILYRMFQKIW